MEYPVHLNCVKLLNMHVSTIKFRIGKLFIDLCICDLIPDCCHVVTIECVFLPEFECQVHVLRDLLECRTGMEETLQELVIALNHVNIPGVIVCVEAF